MKTVVGLFDSIRDARNVVNQLVNAGFERDHVSMVANDAAGEYQADTGGDTEDSNATGAGATTGAVVGGTLGVLLGLGALAIPGIGPVIAAGPLLAGLAGAGVGALAGGMLGALVEAGVPEEDARYYTEGVRRGGTLVVAKVEDEASNEAAEIMNRNHAVNVQERSADWQRRGWSGYDDSAAPYSADEIRAERTHYEAQDTVHPSALTATDTTKDETKIAVVEEELRVGKREVQGGGVRVSAEVVTEPIEQDVSLREEHVRVERRPVDRSASEADFANFRAGIMELTETHEEAIVDKQARVVEEVILSKAVEERTETVRDTVRHTEVDVENIGTGADFRSHFDTTYQGSGASYDTYVPAYRYGTNLASQASSQGREWREIETEARTQWESDNPNTWDEFKDAVRHAWDQARGRA
jgi:uncharacterized protein (TIGR02271 family)